MKFKRILLPIDFSQPARSCLAWAGEHFPGAEFRFLHVWFGEQDAYANWHGDPLKSAREELDKVVQGFSAEYANPTRAEAVSGHPATTICEYALKNDCDLVVMATHGRTGLKHLLVGSVAESVVRHSEVPVLTMPTTRG